MYRFFLTLFLLFPLFAVSEPATNDVPPAVTAVEDVADVEATDARQTGWTNRLVIADAEALGDFKMRWQDSGTKVRLTDATGTSQLDCTLKRRRSTWNGTPDDRFGRDFADGIRVTAMLPNTNAVVTLALRRSRQRCTLYVDGQPALSFADRWDGPIVISTPDEALPEPADAGFVQRLGQFSFNDDFLVDASSPDALQLWAPLSGSWGLHAVTGTVTGTQHRELKRFPKPERSPNFYSLNGEGPHAMIVTGEPFWNHYTFRASVQHNAGTNGILFLMQDGGLVPGHAFTVQTDPASGHLIFALWRGASPDRGLGDLVEAVQSDCVPGQWLMLEVQIHEDRVACLVDNIEVIRRRLALPPGGLFGLYSHAPGGARFDDIRATSHTEMAIDTAADLLPWRLWQTGSLEERTGPLSERSVGDLPFSRVAHLVKSSATNAFEIVYGATNDPPRRIDLALAPHSIKWRAELLAGWQGDDRPHYRLAVDGRGAAAEVSLLHVAPGTTNRILDRHTLQLPDPEYLTLTLDTTAADGLYGRVNGQAVVWSAGDASTVGAAGMALDTGTRAALALPLSRRDIPRLADRFEKNNIYVTDPFMRHWAAPEGQWLEYPDKRAWYKSDVLRQAEIRVPAINGATLHLLIPEGETNGTLQVAVSGNRLTLSQAPAGETNLQEVAQFPLSLFPESQPVADGPLFRFYTARLTDSLFTINCETGLLARCRVPFPHPGRRMMLEGMETAQLAFTRVIREPVLDCLFTESLHDWNINGGNWEVINRFQCYPDWSHMNGESADSLAALWSKYELEGDFSVEFFAGMRHGWYDRLGDLNLTVMNRQATTASGYTVTTAGWDPDHSQMWTRFFRNGRLIEQTDGYTVPRFREGNVRKGYEPLIAAGRDVHGAWYSLRLRRVADRLTFDFDNMRLLDIRDPDPIGKGSFGIWTYRNSMMVARVRITADAIRPRPFRFARIDRLPAPLASAPVQSTGTNSPALAINGWPAQLLQEHLWHVDEADNHTRITFRKAPSASPEMHVRSAQGGGAFLARAHLPDIEAAQLIGWRFEVARHPDAHFNFEYAMGTLQDGVFKVVESLSHYICGTTEERGPRRIAGRISRQPDPTPDGAAERIWTPVVAWLPIEGVAQKLLVRVEGFGNLQPSDIQQGLQGNPPGAWYAVRNLRPVYRGTPVLTSTLNHDLTALRARLTEGPVGKINSLTLPPDIDPTQPVIEWGVMPGSDIALVARPASRPAHSIRVASTLPWPNALLTANNVRINDEPVVVTWIDTDELVVPLPRGIPNDESSVRLSLDLVDSRTFTQLFTASNLYAVSSRRPPTPPILVKFALTNSPLCYQNFESRKLDPKAFHVALPPTLRFDDPLQNSYLRFANLGAASRLQGLLASGYDLARWPLLQFRYRGDSMARVSIHALGSGVINFSENNPNASAIPLAPQARLNDAWHTWMGRVAGFTLTRPVTAGYALMPTDLRIGSLHGQDQTGRYSTFNIDDLAAGPVFGPGQPITFMTDFDAPDSIESCVYSLVAGDTPWDLRPSAQQDQAIWIPFNSRQWTSVSAGDLADGIHHLVVRAKAPGSGWSPVADMPFMIDRTPVVIRSAIVPVGRLNGTVLRLDFDSGEGAPPLMESLQLKSNGQPLAFVQDGSSLVHFQTNGISLELNWPFLLRKSINAAGNGATFDIRCEGLRDAAGNVSPVHQAQIKINYAADKTPPTYPEPKVPTNTLWWAPSMPNPNALFTVNRGLTVDQGRSEDGFAFIGLKGSDKEGMVGRAFATPFWTPAPHRFLALSLRLAPASTFATNAPLFEILFRPRKFPKGSRPHKKGAYLIAFTPKTVADNTALFGNFKWEPGRWNDLIIDVQAFLKRESGSDEPFELQDFNIAIPASTPNHLQIRAGAILMPWAPTDQIVFRAYDASGIAGLFWQGNGQTPQTAIRPARVRLPADDPCWMKAVIRDRAGNNTTPFLLPIPPHNPAAGTLPLAEHWEP